MMPGIGFEEMILLVLVAIVVIGPKDLPLMMRKFGRFTGKMRAMAFEFKQGFDELGRQAELEELKKEVADLKKATGLDDLRRDFEEDKRNLEADVQSALTAVDNPPAPPAATPAVTSEGAQPAVATPPAEGAPALPPPQPAAQLASVTPPALNREVWPRPHKRKQAAAPAADPLPYAGLSADHPGYDAGEDFRIDGPAPEPVAKPANGANGGAHAEPPEAADDGDVHVIPDDHVRPAHPAANLAPDVQGKAKQDTTA